MRFCLAKKAANAFSINKLDPKSMIIIFMLGIYPLIVIPGPLDYFRGPRYLVLVIIFLLSLYFLTYERINFKKPHFYLLGLFLLFALVSTLLARDVTIAWLGSPKWYTGLSTYLFCISLFVLASRTDRTFNYFIPMAAAASMVSVIAVMQHYGLNIVPHELSREGLASFGTMGHPNWLGTYIILVLPAAIYFYMQKKHLLWLLGSALIYAALLATMTRGAWLSFLVVFIIISFYFLRDSKNIKHFLLLLLVLVIVTLIFLPYEDWTLFQRASTIQDEVESSVKLEDRGGSRRIFIWKEAIKVVPDNWLFGLGADNFSEAMVMTPGGIPYHKTHNIYLEILVTMGLFAFISYMAFISYILFRSMKQSFLFVIVILAYLLNGLFNHGVIEVFPLFWVVLGLSLTNEKHFGKETNGEIVNGTANRTKNLDESKLDSGKKREGNLIRYVLKGCIVLFIIVIYFWLFFPSEQKVDIPGGGTYTGELRGSYFHGEGTWHSGYGVTYEGEFKYGKFNGYGKMTFAEGTKYKGEFRENQMHGRGKIIFPDGRVKEGIWGRGVFQEQ